MNRKAWTAVSITAAGTVLAGALIAVSPALGASTPDPAASATGQQYGHRYRGGAAPGTGQNATTAPGAAAMNGAGPGNGAGRTGQGGGPGACACASPTAATGTLTDSQKTTLRAMAEEEKMAHDLYAAFAARYPLRIFDRISTAESTHLDAIRALLARYQIADPTAGKAASAFASATVQATYDKLLAQGSAGQAAALGAGRTVEQTDITDLTRALTGLTAPDVTQVYQHLLAASRQHLAAFQNQLN